MPEKFAKQIVACNIVTAVMLFVVGGGVGGALLLGYARGDLREAPRVEFVEKPVTVTKTVTEYAQRFCPLDVGPELPASIKGWLRYQDQADCFSIDYPAGWKVYPSESGVGFNGDGVNVYVFRQSDNEPVDSKNTYDSYRSAPNMTELRPGVLADTQWSIGEGESPAGDGRVKQIKVVTGRGVFTIRLGALEAKATDANKALLERIASTFQAQ